MKHEEQDARSDQPQPGSRDADQRDDVLAASLRDAFDAGLRLGSKGEGWAPEDYEAAFSAWLLGWKPR